MSSGPYLFNARTEHGTFEDQEEWSERINYRYFGSSCYQFTSKLSWKKIRFTEDRKASKKAKSLYEKTDVYELKVTNLNAKQMTDNEIREEFVEAKEWENGFAQMIKSN